MILNCYSLKNVEASNTWQEHSVKDTFSLIVQLSACPFNMQSGFAKYMQYSQECNEEQQHLYCDHLDSKVLCKENLLYVLFPVLNLQRYLALSYELKYCICYCLGCMWLYDFLT